MPETLLDEDVVERAGAAIAKALNPELFCGDPQREHREASPLRVDFAKLAALAKGRLAARAALASLQPSVSEMSDRLYDIHWQRQSEDDRMMCASLTPRVMMKRIRGAIRNSGPVIIHAIEPSALSPEGEP